MTKITVQHVCGHEGIHAVSGSEQDQKLREEWLRRQPCQTCWREKQTGSASAQSQEWNLPPLEGSDEEKSWAEVIRMKAIAHNRDYHKKLTGNPELGKEEETMRTAILRAADDALRELESQQSAAWWIAHRFDSLAAIRTRVVEAIAPIVDSQEQAK
jgi:hypothetical protein